MSTKNSYSVYIDGINRTGRAAIPLKWAKLLDERLDECYLSLRSVKKNIFAPLTPVEIRLSNLLYWHSGESGTETRKDVSDNIRYFVVANDSATENPLGSGLYDHELYLLEVTKVLERTVVDTSTVTNDLGRNYTENAVLVEPIVTEE